MEKKAFNGGYKASGRLVRIGDGINNRSHRGDPTAAKTTYSYIQVDDDIIKKVTASASINGFLREALGKDVEMWFSERGGDDLLVGIKADDQPAVHSDGEIVTGNWIFYILGVPALALYGAGLALLIPAFILSSKNKKIRNTIAEMEREHTSATSVG
ncbi:MULTISPECIES: hypothetical protein [unclassified Guyparkeria]|uniref:hypothetical protein n=1 Tax=unclassified Guyparkeria TaxID=2626246 RepID=UPI00073357B4|nr:MULTISPECIES: hypothetical protein [unclassified Guyparkeria]KTG16000.1 hypothetical protein AUR63_06000 [Guyparkeria sp. XI15]OAE84755.1 hypothetical protein AWR35_06010 [Guyparkeria sp. WRN-7]